MSSINIKSLSDNYEYNLVSRTLNVTGKLSSGKTVKFILNIDLSELSISPADELNKKIIDFVNSKIFSTHTIKIEKRWFFQRDICHIKPKVEIDMGQPLPDDKTIRDIKVMHLLNHVIKKNGSQTVIFKNEAGQCSKISSHLALVTHMITHAKLEADPKKRLEILFDIYTKNSDLFSNTEKKDETIITKLKEEINETMNSPHLKEEFKDVLSHFNIKTLADIQKQYQWKQTPINKFDDAVTQILKALEAKDPDNPNPETFFTNVQKLLEADQEQADEEKKLPITYSNLIREYFTLAKEKNDIKRFQTILHITSWWFSTKKTILSKDGESLETLCKTADTALRRLKKGKIVKGQEMRNLARHNISIQTIYQTIDGTDARLYLTIQKLGQGTFGLVNQVTDLTTNRQQALKIAVTERIEEKFSVDAANECEILKFLFSGPNPPVGIIRPVTLVTTSDGQIGVMAPLCRGDYCGELKKNQESVQQYSKKVVKIKNTLHFNQKMKDTSRLLQGLETLARKGVAHCDIKTENIFMTDEGASLADFGGALLKSDHKKPYGFIVHTKDCTPEKEKSCLSDDSTLTPENRFQALQQIAVFQMGFALWEIFSGGGAGSPYPRIRGGNANGYANTKGKYKDLPSTVPKPIRALIQEMLNPDPEKRISAEDALKKFQKIEGHVTLSL